MAVPERDAEVEGNMAGCRQLLDEASRRIRSRLAQEAFSRSGTGVDGVPQAHNQKTEIAEIAGLTRQSRTALVMARPYSGVPSDYADFIREPVKRGVRAPSPSRAWHADEAVVLRLSGLLGSRERPDGPGLKGEKEQPTDLVVRSRDLYRPRRVSSPYFRASRLSPASARVLTAGQRDQEQRSADFVSSLVDKYLRSAAENRQRRKRDELVSSPPPGDAELRLDDLELMGSRGEQANFWRASAQEPPLGFSGTRRVNSPQKRRARSAGVQKRSPIQVRDPYAFLRPTKAFLLKSNGNIPPYPGRGAYGSKAVTSGCFGDAASGRGGSPRRIPDVVVSIVPASRAPGGGSGPCGGGVNPATAACRRAGSPDGGGVDELEASGVGRASERRRTGLGEVSCARFRERMTRGSPAGRPDTQRERGTDSHPSLAPLVTAIGAGDFSDPSEPEGVGRTPGNVDAEPGAVDDLCAILSSSPGLPGSAGGVRAAGGDSCRQTSRSPPHAAAVKAAQGKSRAAVSPSSKQAGPRSKGAPSPRRKFSNFRYRSSPVKKEIHHADFKEFWDRNQAHVERVGEKVEALREELAKGMTFQPELLSVTRRIVERKKQEAVFDPYEDLPDIEYSEEGRQKAREDESSFCQDPEFLRKARAKAAAGITYILYTGSPVIGAV